MTGWSVSSVGGGVGVGVARHASTAHGGRRRTAAAVIRPGRRPGAVDPSQLMSRAITRCSGAVFSPAHKASQQF